VANESGLPGPASASRFTATGWVTATMGAVDQARQLVFLLMGTGISKIANRRQEFSVWVVIGGGAGGNGGGRRDRLWRKLDSGGPSAHNRGVAAARGRTRASRSDRRKPATGGWKINNDDGVPTFHFGTSGSLDDRAGHLRGRRGVRGVVGSRSPTSRELFAQRTVVGFSAIARSRRPEPSGVSTNQVTAGRKTSERPRVQRCGKHRLAPWRSMRRETESRWLCRLLRGRNVQWSATVRFRDMEDTSRVSQLDVCGQGSPQTADCE
jgi:hypothetical protein